MKIKDYNLTNDAQFLIASMYKDYLDKRKSGTDKRLARRFNTVDDIHDSIMPQWSTEDVLDTCFELRTKKLIIGSPANNTLVMISLTTDAVAALEISFMDKTESVIDFISKIKNAIPFI